MVGKFFGSLFGGAGREPERALDEQLPLTQAEELEQTRAALGVLRSAVRRAGALLPTLASSRVRQTDDILANLIDYIAENGASTEQRVLLNAIITDYLPTSLRVYRALPPETHTDTSPESEKLLEQLDILHSTALDLDHQVRTGAIAELSVHGRFLQDKFDVGGIRLAPGEGEMH
ncbi:hypothetical protein GCM10027449_08340 [Sinomonas notoginsengisoli]|uniref:hypothetical protein n=1 Tax=Sinomonas notoginsengisoli TaxID=1457311 RepID=UPI001F42AB1A|nr:hypothetical protein [Sinomonas notoginsengisoli]